MLSWMHILISESCLPRPDREWIVKKGLEAERMIFIARRFGSCGDTLWRLTAELY